MSNNSSAIRPSAASPSPGAPPPPAGPSGGGVPAPGQSEKRPIPEPINGLQVNHCRNPNCTNFGVEPQIEVLPPGRAKGHVVKSNYPPASEASCRKEGCPNRGKTIAEAPELYAPEPKYGNAVSDAWRCRSCRSRVRVAAARANRAPVQPPRHRDLYRLEGGEMRCHNCQELVTVRSNQAVVEETARLCGYLEPKRGPTCSNDDCPEPGHAIDDEDAADHYQEYGITAAGSKRYRCKHCGTVLSVSRSAISGQRRSEINILFFKLLRAKVPLGKIADVLEISWPTVYDKIDFLQTQSLKFLGDREAQIGKRSELLLATDRQAYLCNWNLSADARNIQITGVATADTRSGYVLGMNVAYDPEQNPAEIDADAIRSGDPHNPVAMRKYARLWLDSDFAESSVFAASVRDKRRRQSKERRQAEDYDEWEEDIEVEDDDDEMPASIRRLPETGMLVHDDYTLHAHFRLLRRILKETDRICFYTEKEPGIRSAIMSGFREEMLEDRIEAFHVMVTKGLTVKRRRFLLGQSRAAFRRWLKARRKEGRITTEDWEQCRIIRLLEAVDSPDFIADRRGERREPWVWHPFANMAEPERRMLHLTSRVLEASKGARGKMALRPRPPLDRQRLAYLYDQASLHAVDRYFQNIRRDISALERPVRVASNKRRAWRGYSPYDPSLIQQLIDIHRAYYNFVQVSKKDGKSRAQRFGLARGRIRYHDIIYYR